MPVSWRKTTAWILALAVMTTAFAASPLHARKKKNKDLPRVTHDGLELVPESKVLAAWAKPGIDLSGYRRILILDTLVAFRKNWANEFNRSSVYRVTNRDVERMKTDMAALFREVFVKVLEADDGYPVVEAADTDVLLLRPAIIDLDVTSPALDTPGRSYNFAASAGSATLYLELYDSVSGEILARVIDQQVAREIGGVMQWRTQVSNRVAAQEILGRWAKLLRTRLDEIHAAHSG